MAQPVRDGVWQALAISAEGIVVDRRKQVPPKGRLGDEDQGDQILVALDKVAQKVVVARDNLPPAQPRGLRIVEDE